MATDTTVVYSENAAPGGNRTILAVLGITIIAVVVALVVDAPAVALIAVILGAVAAVTAFSLQRYSGIRVTADELAVGRDKLAIAALDPAHGVRRGEDALPDDVRASLELGISAKRGDLRILGGAWGRPKTGSSWLVVQERGGHRYVIATRSPEQLTAVLGPLINAPAS